MKLNILIATIPERQFQFDRLCDEIVKQVTALPYTYGIDVKILSDNAPKGTKTIGAKRDDLLKLATADYVCFIDDDDIIAPDYIKNVMQGIELGVDCCSLRGIITWDGQNPEIFEHSNKYQYWATTSNRIRYVRTPNHLNVIKREIAIQVGYQSINHGEDHDFSMRLKESGLIKTEHYIDEVIYNYNYISVK